MSLERAYSDYLRDMLDATEKATPFTAGMDLTAFEADEKTAFAVVRALEIIGEAAKNVPMTVWDRYPELPWRAMAGMRDKVIHEYFGVNLKVVWQTIEEDLPLLRAALPRIVAEAEEG